MSRRNFDSPVLYSVKDVIVAGTETLGEGEMLMVDNFTLLDSMSAVEIMDPRMDSGIQTSPASDKPFDPRAALLPEEVCWILDRAMACEMTWHQGYTLTQTVYTCRHVHHTYALSLEGTKPNNPLSESLRQIVLRSGIYGMLKCCDMTWRELNKGNVIDTEDWNSEKADVSLAESVQLPRVIDMLQNAILWLETSPQMAKDPWQERLKCRLQLRLALLYILSDFSTDLNTHYELARAHLLNLISDSENQLTPKAEVPGVFDNTIGRELPSFLPLPTIKCLTADETLDFVLRLVESRSVVSSLEASNSLLEWKVTSSLYSYKGCGRSCDLPSFSRSRAMSAFYNDEKILGRHPPSWVVDQFFLEHGNVSPGSMFKVAHSTQSRFMSFHAQTASKQIDEFEQEVSKLLVHYFTSCFHSRSRQRRQFANAIPEWQRAFAESEDILHTLRAKSPIPPMLERVPLIIQYHRLELVREVIFSGFELELYSPHEVAFVYWYMTGPLNTQCGIINLLCDSMREDQNDTFRISSHYLNGEFSLGKALSLMCQAFARLICRFHVQTDLPLERQQLNLLRRFKWSFGLDYAGLDSHDPATPDFEGFEMWKEGIQMEEKPLVEVNRLLDQAREHLHVLVGEPAAPPFKLCGEERRKLLQSLLDTCEAWAGHILRDDAGSISYKNLLWSHDRCSWFPLLTSR